MDFPSGTSLALLLTLLAGLSTGIGGLMAILIRKPKASYLAFGLGLSCGVMIYIALVELLPHSILHTGELWGIIAFALGVVLIAAIDMLIPKAKNPHECPPPTENGRILGSASLMRAGMLTALAITIHNVPEGLATFGTSLENVQLGVIIAIAIAIHNIPEGISVALPIYCSTGSRRKALGYALLSGLGEPLGALIGLTVLLPFLSAQLLAGLLGFVAGIMMYVSLDELLPLARAYQTGHEAIAGIFIGMVVIALSLYIL